MSKLEVKMANVTLRAESVVRGYHVYKEDWIPNLGDRFGVKIEEANIHDRYAVAIVVDDRITGHMPREFSKAVYYFIKNNGVVQGTVTGRRKRSSLPLKGLEIPCIYEFTAKKKKVQILKKLLQKHVHVSIL